MTGVVGYGAGCYCRTKFVRRLSTDIWGHVRMGDAKASMGEGEFPWGITFLKESERICGGVSRRRLREVLPGCRRDVFGSA